ncbi:nodulation protein NodH [Roseicyclus marinus]|uniref:nodulation protein NodH n=1 Tax=Roseicyclus marinus TaxID=2161673 RepID=UPI0024102CAA|nr:nodulation protein NodH [Roseicyclus marinus]MDG3041474.1 nodulation protein NodH [Roseicyclus marinus]
MAARRFDAFVLFAEMRTGSNYLEDSLNALPDITCHGEVYNPTFLGQHNRFDLFGFDMARREADPLGLLDAIIAQTPGLPGFRLFHDHDDRVVDRILPDPRIAKVILTRNPLDSYVSRKIATATGQWRLTDARNRKEAKIVFDADEFAELMDRLARFQDRLRRGLQVTGQTAFHVRYEDINDPEVLNGLAAFLGSEGRVDSASRKLKRQNPGDLADKVENYDEMLAALRDVDRFGLTASPDAEPTRGAAVPGFVAHPTAGLLFLPLKGAPEQAVLDWMGEIGGVGRDALLRRMSQKELRQWMKDHPGHRSFSVLRHPVKRAYNTFCRFVLPDDRAAYEEARKVMRQRYNLPIPGKAPGPDWTAAEQKAAFHAFLEFLKPNLDGQTSVRIDAAWASQAAILQGMAQILTPHALIAEEDMAQALPDMARAAGVTEPPAPRAEVIPGQIALDDIYDGKIEKAAIDAYRRDYLTLGFPRWNRR